MRGAVFYRVIYSLSISTPCPLGSTIQHWAADFPEPQKHCSIVPQHAPYIFPDPHEHVAINFAFCSSSIKLENRI